LVVLGVPEELPLEDPVEVPLEDVVELVGPCATVPETPVEPDRVELELAQGPVVAPASVVAGIGVLWFALLPGMVALGLPALVGDDVVVERVELDDVPMVPVVPGVAEVVPVVVWPVTDPLGVALVVPGVAVPVVCAPLDGETVAPPVGAALVAEPVCANASAAPKNMLPRNSNAFFTIAPRFNFDGLL
jgi:hypothetical protein